MNNQIIPEKGKTVITTGKGKNKTIITAKPQISSQGKILDLGNMVDTVFVFDTTGSMGNKIEALLLTCKQFVTEAKSLNLDSQFALISFGDISIQGGGDTINLVVPLTNDIEKIGYGLTNIPENNGFGNEGESCLEAIHEAFKISHRKRAVKVMIIITDEPALQHNISVKKVIQELKTHEYLVFVIAPDLLYYKEMAIKNGGTWKEIGSQTDLSTILELFKKISKKIYETAQEVHLMGSGSVSKYLALKAPKNR